MSSFTGTPAANGQATDPSLQEAPRGEEAPDFGTLKKAFDDTIISCSPYVDQCRENFQTRYALWDNQSADGRKHARETSNGKVDPTPWDGASDLRVFLTDEAINCKVAMQSVAFRKANVVATPTEGNDIKRAKTVSSFMRWTLINQIPNAPREAKLLSNYIQEKGVGAIGVFWERSQSKTLVTVTLDQIQQQFPDVDMQAVLYLEEAAEDLMAVFERQYGCSGKKAKKMLRELREGGTTTVPTLGKVKSRPVIRAFNLDQDLFIPDSATDFETTPAAYRVQYFSAEQLRSFVHTDEWDADWVEDAIERCRGQYVTMVDNYETQPWSRSFIYTQQRLQDLVGVVYAYQRLSDEDGVPGLYCTIFNPQLPPNDKHNGYAKHGLLGYSDGEMPFVLFRREYLSRKAHDTRGIPEVGLPSQMQIKVHKDSRIDAASIAILPPMGYPVGRPPGRWGAGARVPERRPNEYHFLDRPQVDGLTEKSEDQLRADWNQYNGFVSKETDPTFASLINQDQADDFLECWGFVMKKIWSRCKQYGPEKVFFRVTGVHTEEPIEFDRGEDGEEFDFTLKYQLDFMDPEKMEKKLEALAKIAATFDKFGQVDYSELLQIAVEMIEPSWAERIILPKETGAQRVTNEAHTMLAQVFSGVDRDIDINSPPDIVMSAIQQYVQQPDVQQRYQSDEAFKARFDKIVKQVSMQQKQNLNKKIGRYGA
jgi:hypothetical protein